MKVNYQAIAALGEALLAAHGVPADCATLQVDLLLEAQMRGFASHGLLRLPRILERIDAGVTEPRARGRHEWHGAGQLIVDGQRGLGPVVVTTALEAIQERARDTGVAMAAIRNSNHIGMLAWYGEQVAKNGLLLIGATTSEALVHPWGGRRAMLGTNPLCIAVPAWPDPLILDMATSLVSMGKVHDYANRGVPLEQGWALDASGNPTTDASAAKSGAIAPFGGAKGYALGIALEVLVTSLAGCAIGTQVGGTLDSDQVCNKGDVFIVIAPRQGAGIEALVASFLDEIRSSEPADSARPVAIPGDRARRERARSITDGVEIDEGLWRDLLALEQTNHSARNEAR